MNEGFPFYNPKQNSISPSREEALEVRTLLVDFQAQSERVGKEIKVHIRGWAQLLFNSLTVLWFYVFKDLPCFCLLAQQLNGERKESRNK